MNKHPIIAAVALIVGIMGTVFAMSDRFIATATFLQFKEHIVFRLDSIDHKLDLLIEKKIIHEK